MDDKDYYGLEALSQSGAKALLVSPAQFRAERDTPKADTPDMAMGRLVHALVLEPDTVAQRFSTGPDIPKPDLSHIRKKDGTAPKKPANTVEGKELLEAWQDKVDAWFADNAHLCIITADNWAKCKAMAASLLGTPHPELGLTLADLLALDGAQTEVPIVWTDAVTGAKCKAKLDVGLTLPNGKAMVVDPKTTAKPMTAKALSTAIADFGYHRQVAAYLEAMASTGVYDAEFWFIFVSKTAPHEAAWIKLNDAAVQVGAQEWDAAKAIYAACVKNNVWPSAQIAGLLPTELGLPGWYRSGVSDE